MVISSGWRPLHSSQLRNPHSPWEGLISAGVPSFSVTPSAEGAKKIPQVWEKEPRELSARADLGQLTPVPRWSSCAQGISKPTARLREHDQPHQSFLLDPKLKHKKFYLAPIPLPLLHFGKVVYWTRFNRSSWSLWSLDKYRDFFVSLCIKFSIFQ